MAQKGPSLGVIEQFAQSLGINREPSQKRKPELKKRAKIQKKIKVERVSLGKAIERKEITEEIAQEQRLFLSETKNKQHQKLIDRAINPTLEVARRKDLGLDQQEVLKEALYALLETNGHLPLRKFDRLCTQKRKEVMSLALRKEVDEKLGIGKMRKELAKMELEKGILSDEVDAEFAFEKNKKGSKDIEWSLENYKQYRPLLRLVSRKSGVSEKELLVFGTIESRFKKFARNGSSKGLMQMQRAATIDSVKGLNADLKGAKTFAKNLHASELIYDPLINLILAAEYIKVLKKAAIDNGINPVRISDIYTLFNQGVRGGLKAMKNEGLINAVENPTHRKTKKKMTKMPWGDFVVS